MTRFPIRVGLLGFGASAKTFHLPFILDRPDLFAVAAVLERRAQESPKLLPAARVHRDLEGFLADPGWDLAVITLPNDLHASTAVRVLATGRPAVIEKPLAVTAAEGQAVLDASRRAGQPVFAFQSRRLDGDFALVRNLVEREVLGRLVRVEVRYDRWANALRPKAWKEQGAVGNSLLEDLGSHLLDQALTLFGTPRTLTSRLGVQRDGSRTVDAFRISLEYGPPRTGLWVDLEAGMVARAPLFHWSLQGTEGAFVKSGMDPQESQLQAGWAPRAAGFGIESSEQAGRLYRASGETELLSSPPGRYADFYADVAASIAEGRPSSFPAEDGLRVVQLLELCRLSAEQGRTVAVT